MTLNHQWLIPLLTQAYLPFHFLKEAGQSEVSEKPFNPIFLPERAGYHLAKALRLPDNIVLWHLLAYCPELNGIERFWQEVKRHMAWQNFVDAQELEQWKGQELQSYEKQTLASLVGYPYISEAINKAMGYASS